MHRSAEPSPRFFLSVLYPLLVVGLTTPLSVLAQASPGAGTGYAPPKVIKFATSAVPNVDTGTVIVEVIVRADGTSGVKRIVSSTNHNDDKAALDIARRSVYKPATKGGMPIVSVFDVTLNFKGNGLNRY